MFTIAIVGQKGGTGKTTTAINLAVAAAETGLASVIVDIDPQANAANWKDRRAADNPAVESVPASRLRQTLDAARTHGADFIVIDTPGIQETAVIEAVKAANLVLVPVDGKSIFNLETLPAVRTRLTVAGNPPAYVLLNYVHPQATTQAEQVKALIAESYEFQVCPIHFTRREIHAEAQTNGKSAQEHEPEGKAAAEIKRFYKFICQQLNKLDSPHEKPKKLAAGH